MQDIIEPIHGPLTTPKAFRRVTGAHAIMVSLLVADLAGFLLAILSGALIGSPLRWLLRASAHVLHTSVILDISLILFVLCFGIGQYQERVLKKTRDDAWGCAGLLMLLIGAALPILFLVKTEWMTLPAHVIPNIPLEGFQWIPSFMTVGAVLAASLYLLAHLIVFWRSRQEPEKEVRSFSRAHPDGQVWLLIEQAYALYRRSLMRFNPPAITRLKTPPTFYYYQRQINPDDIPAPEREMYWRGGHLVINQIYIGHKQEQAEILLPFLARLLYDYNSPDQVIKRLFELAHVGDAMPFSAWLLLIPLSTAQACETRWEAAEWDYVLDRDRFAYYCGEGKRLRRALQRQIDSRNAHGQPDNAIPTLVERIDHLDSLIGREAMQVKKLRDALPLAPPPSPPTNEGHTREEDFREE